MPLITTTFVFNFAWNLSLLDEENTGKHFIGFYSVKECKNIDMIICYLGEK